MQSYIVPSNSYPTSPPEVVEAFNNSIRALENKSRNLALQLLMRGMTFYSIAPFELNNSYLSTLAEMSKLLNENDKLDEFEDELDSTFITIDFENHLVGMVESLSPEAFLPSSQRALFLAQIDAKLIALVPTIWNYLAKKHTGEGKLNTAVKFFSLATLGIVELPDLATKADWAVELYKNYSCTLVAIRDLPTIPDATKFTFFMIALNQFWAIKPTKTPKLLEETLAAWEKYLSEAYIHVALHSNDANEALICYQHAMTIIDHIVYPHNDNHDKKRYILAYRNSIRIKLELLLAAPCSEESFIEMQKLIAKNLIILSGEHEERKSDYYKLHQLNFSQKLFEYAVNFFKTTQAPQVIQFFEYAQTVLENTDGLAVECKQLLTSIVSTKDEARVFIQQQQLSGIPFFGSNQNQLPNQTAQPSNQQYQQYQQVVFR